MDNFRVRVLPVLGAMPAIFGDAMAAYVLCQLAGQPFTCVIAIVWGLHRLTCDVFPADRVSYPKSGSPRRCASLWSI